jgi:hypothetical protein
MQQERSKMRSWAVTLLILALAGAGPASARDETEDRCNKVADQLCGTTPLGTCFSDDALWAKVPDVCIGPIQTNIEMAREATEQSGEMGARSWGGHLRAGPGQEYKSLGLLAEGEPVTILERTDTLFQDYPWFRVDTAKGEGYHWGGVLCSTGEPIDGVYLTCQ